MRISAIYGGLYNYSNPYQTGLNNYRYNERSPMFTGIPNAGPVKKLFKYNLPNMYRDIVTIDPRHANKLVRSGAFNKPSILSMAVLKTFEDNICDVEKRVYRVLLAQSKANPKKDIQEILDSLAPKYEKRLRKKQEPIFEDLDEMSKSLSPEYKELYDTLMCQTRKKLANEPIVLPFSKEDFMYKLHKIKGDIGNIKNPKAVKVVDKLLLEAEKIPEINSAENEPIQHSQMEFLRKILGTSVLQNYVPLKELFSSVSARIDKKEMIVPFSRKTFIYDLKKILETYPDGELKERMMEKAKSLPTSRNSIAAYIVKFHKEPSDKIAFRLLSPTYASIEHIEPRANGGPNELENFGIATVRDNSDRGNIDFTEQIKKMRGTKRNSQKLINRLIELYKNGIFDKCGVPFSYITGLIKKIDEQSKGQIKLNTRKLNNK